MKFTAAQICKWLNGTIEGNPNCEVWNIEKIETANSGDLSFIANIKYIKFLYTTKASILIIANDLILEKPVTATLIRVENPYEAFSVLLETYNKLTKPALLIEQPCFIDNTAVISNEVYIGAFCYIGTNVTIKNKSYIYPQCYIGNNVVIGENTTLYPGVKIYENCIIGNNCTIHSGVVIGSDGFGFAPQTNNTYKKIPQIGNVVLGNNIEIGANTTIDRATMGSTIINDGVKLDNLIQIAHNVEIGENTVIAAQTGVSGSTKIGKNCIIGGQVGIVGHIQLANGTKIGAQSGVPNTIKEENETYIGSPILPHKDALKTMIVMKQLPEMYKKIKELETIVKNKS